MAAAVSKTESGASDFCIFGPGDDFVHKAGGKLDEIGAVASHADHKVTVFFRVCLCILESLLVGYDELNMFAIVGKISFNRGGKFHLISIGCDG